MKKLAVLGVLLTDEGKRIKEEMLQWLNTEYDVLCIEQEPPGSQFEYPAIKFAAKLSVDMDSPVLYLHTKGAANPVPAWASRMMNPKFNVPYSAKPEDCQKVIRNLWKHEFTGKRLKEYLAKCNTHTPTVCCPYTGKEKWTWWNAWIINPPAAQILLKNLKQTSYRWYYERMFSGIPEISVIGMRMNNLYSNTFDDTVALWNDIWSFMDKRVYTFWEGRMPEYLKLCMETWKFPFILLTYDNINQYTDKIPEKLKQLTLPKQADYIRVHVLRDNGGIWLDTDTIMLNDELPSECILGDDVTRTNTIGFLQAEPQSDFFDVWSAFQDWKLNRLQNMKKDTSVWNIMGNAFTDRFLKDQPDIKIGVLEQNWPETYMIKGNAERYVKYRKFYFESNFSLSDIKDKTNMLMLHNSWTPDWYKQLSSTEVLYQNCTLSNILRELR